MTTVTNQSSLYTQQRFLFMTLDPVHIGAGGYRLGRVDMTIAREPGTNLPKIPGTSIAGATRSYASMRYGKPEAAGQHKKLKGNRDLCPIIYTFGTATDTVPNNTENINRAGTVSIGDAQILFFPVNSMAGPVWVSTKEKIMEVWGQNSVTLPNNLEPTDDSVITNLDWQQELNLSWLLFLSTPGLVLNPPTNLQASQEWLGISKRIVLVTNKLFSQIVNSNLEVRTSVSIDPKTGAAEQKALFTYEAIPRTTWLWSDIVEDDYRRNSDGITQFPETSKQCKKSDEQEGQYIENAGEPLGEIWKQPLDVVRAGIKLIEYLGIGGMGTRGFGRMRSIGDWNVDDGAHR